MPSSYDKELHTAIEAVRESARLCTAIQGVITTETLEKKDRSPVTVADFGSQALVCRRLAEVFPEDSIISEEESSALQKVENTELLDRVVREVRRHEPQATASTVCQWIDHGKTIASPDRFWTLDPIDGTKGFLRGEQYAISLALIVDGNVQLGVLGCPNLSVDAASATGAVFSAVLGKGAFVQSLDMEEVGKHVRVSATQDLKSARFCESVESAHSSHGHAQAIASELGITAPPVRLDSQAKYAIVSRGEADIYMRLPTRADYREKIWDHAAGVLLVMEAGGQVTDISGATIEFTHGATLDTNRGILATNGHCHASVLAAMQKIVGI